MTNLRAAPRSMRATLAAPEAPPPWLLASLLVLVTMALVGAGFFVYDYQRDIITRQKQDELTAVADIKVAQVSGWLAQRRADAEAAAADAFLAREVARWIARGAPADASSELIAARLASLKSTLGCRGVVLLDLAGRRRAAAGDSDVDASERELAVQAMRANKATLTDFYLRQVKGEEHVEFDVFAPLLEHSGGGTRVAGALYFKMDPQQYLFPLIQGWPTPSPSAEALLVRREGDEVVYLSEPRYRKGWELRLRQPVATPRLSAAMAVRGEPGLFEGVDYRGVQVLAAARMVPGVPWFVVAKVDAAEVYAPIDTLAIIVTALEAIFVVGIAGGGALWWRHQRAHFLMRQYQGELERRALAQHLDYLAKYANDIILLIDGGGRIVDANDRAISCYGYPRDALLRLNVRALRADAREDPLGQAKRLPRGHGVVFESVHRREDGSSFPAETSLRAIEIDGREFYQAIVRDISERKRAEQALREGEERLRLALEAARVVAWEWDPVADTLVQSANAGEIWGTAATDATWLGTAARKALVEGGTFVVQSPQPGADGTVVQWLEARGRAVRDPASDTARVSGIVMDITERKHAEEQLRLAAQVFESSNEGIVVTDAENRIISVNRAYTEITGYAPDEVIGKNPRLVSSGRQDPEFYRAMWAAIETAGRWEGELWNRRKCGEIYPQWLAISTVRDETGRICNHIGFFSDITERRAAAERIQFLAHYDALTHLPNRFLLQERLQQAIPHHQRHRKRLALLFLDLDRFKLINDTLGHAVGDELLKAVALRLQSCVREGDTVARLGGDEFVLVLPEVAEAGDAAHVARKIVECTGRVYLIAGQAVSTSPSIGISLYPDDGADAGTLIQHADVAMYHAKAQGRNNYQFYTEEMNIRAFEALAMENALRRALAQGELLLHYQPQMDVRTGAIVGVEALLRWQHPDKGLLPASSFVPIAETCGLMAPIGDWVLATACGQNQRWQAAGLPPVRMTVNISSQQFQQKHFPETVAQVLRDTGLASRYLDLDLSEEALMAGAENAQTTLAGLADLGAGVSIDDFGSGYCSLHCLKRFAIGGVKLDPSFVRDIGSNAEDAAVAGAIIAMAKSMKLKVLAEGVETGEQLAVLRSQRCDEIQGYYFSGQLPAEQVAALLAA